MSKLGRPVSSRDLFANFERMRREIDEIFGDVFERSGIAGQRVFIPEVDVYYCGDPPRAVVKAALPGVEIDDVVLEVHGRQLTISGQRRPQESEGRVYQQIEIPQGPFQRLVDLGAACDPKRASATYEEGILRVEIPLLVEGEAAQRINVEGRGRGDGE